jgi:FlaA1/EpsC-like NDP-sugar epimerase
LKTYWEAVAVLFRYLKSKFKQLAPVTVPHSNMTPYFMTVSEILARHPSRRVRPKGGEIFVLDRGEPVKIVDLAKNLIKLFGYTIEEIDIEFTGIRPSEKLCEELMNENEVPSSAGVAENIYWESITY